MQKTYASLLFKRGRVSAVILAMLVLALAGLMLAELAQPATAQPAAQDTTQPAQDSAAQPAQEPDQLHVEHPAPNCVKAENHSFWGYVKVKNTCKDYQRVKVIIAWGPDSPCYGLNPGKSTTYWYLSGRFDGLESC